ncbi:hypothetical protein ED388_12990 [Muribaculaceae bacterium Isolate-007 (NCI)]|nr:hypothetical protein ED388_12990 [Muribaculaceae bacterium Isolate-007 (NCI)]
MAIFGFDCYVTNSAVYNVATISESGNDGHAYGYIYVRGIRPGELLNGFRYAVFKFRLLRKEQFGGG